MVLTLYLMGREVFTIAIAAGAVEDEKVTRIIGFAAAELADVYVAPER